jgi:aminopeptidase N
MYKVLFYILGAVVVGLLAAAPARAQEGLPVYELSVSFSPGESLLEGNARIDLPAGGQWEVGTAGLQVLEASLDAAPLDAGAINRDGGLKVEGGGVLRLGYRAVLAGTAEDIQNVGVVGSIVSPEGISLTGGWYPAVKGLAFYKLTAVVPAGFTAVSEADSIEVAEGSGGRTFSFRFGHPSEGVSLAAGKYTVLVDKVGDTEVLAYFFAEEAHLAKGYLEYAKRYIGMYEEMLGPYPYERFSVVENVVSTGYSMPTYTLLGRDVVRLPFIVETSLGHEVLHQWFGNSVYLDPAEGNWLEGITTYLADHFYEEMKGNGADYRKKILVDFHSYVTPDKEMPLDEFRGRVDQATRAIGYGKCAMVFHMLRERFGNDVFFDTLRSFYGEFRFRRASWTDIRKAFEGAAGEELEGFFSQWLKRPGVPALDVKDLKVRYVDGSPHAEFKLLQTGGGEPYALDVRARFVTRKGERVETLSTDEKEKSFSIKLEGEPREMVLDGEYDLMRGLWESETPPTVARLVGDSKRLLVVPDGGVDTYLPLTKLLRGEGFVVAYENEVKDEDLLSSSVLLLGTDGPVQRRLFGGPVSLENREGFVLKVMKNPLDPDRVVAVAFARDAAEVEPAARKIFHYGKYSYLRFEGGVNVEKETAASEDGMRVDLSYKVTGVKPASAVDLDRIIGDVTDKDIIYVGESHTAYEDHRVQLLVIRALREGGRPVAVGMEMFQRPFQEALDDYIAGRTTEREFLKASEYYKRWGFDYQLYREILQYARAYGIPVVALNIDSTIIEKVASGGLDALSEEEKEKLPASMDMTDGAYRERLEEVFGLHRNPGERSFENFYQSQILWDETMAHSVHEFLTENPGYKMVVLVGVGHVAWGSGIPQRAYRLGRRSYAILINASGVPVEEGVADYVLFPEPLEPPRELMLGVILEKSDEGLKIKEVRPGSAAGAAGLRKGDVFVSLDGVEVGDVADIKVALFGHEAGDKVKATILRKRLFGRSEKELEVTLR